MRAFCVVVLVLITAGVAYCAYIQGWMPVSAPQPMRLVERESPTWFDEVHVYEATRDADWRRWRQYDAAYSRGLVHSGIDDVDEAVVATYGLDYAHPQLTPQRWRKRWNAGAKWCEEREDRSGPSEECTDWQGRDRGLERRDARPVWVEPRRESQYRRAFRHLLFGVDESERL